jgi:hypothetical protein
MSTRPGRSAVALPMVPHISPNTVSQLRRPASRAHFSHALERALRRRLDVQQTSLRASSSHNESPGGEAGASDVRILMVGRGFSSSRRPWLPSAPAGSESGAVLLQPISNFMSLTNVPLSAASHGSDYDAQRRNQRTEHADNSGCERSSNTGWQGRAGSGSERPDHRT